MQNQFRRGSFIGCYDDGAPGIAASVPGASFRSQRPDRSWRALTLPEGSYERLGAIRQTPSLLPLHVGWEPPVERRWHECHRLLLTKRQGGLKHPKRMPLSGPRSRRGDLPASPFPESAIYKLQTCRKKFGPSIATTPLAKKYLASLKMSACHAPVLLHSSDLVRQVHNCDLVPRLA